ncbi:helix-turn-helix domain-containing protein [Anaerovorax odorimutans]|uniref:Helix-turn-helix domain-containing protein n=1 Tax=Anaerovorax odorimutans TaxID=109327 RepID=A0ABT1RM80_9FIRM|nr:helix-turn-helix domain-containing protein [Anaerovorax odorimutans]MCQ4636293.1 helix-turn-helix domain-containing protein [Anaerovorax odorimutans]
MLEERLQYPEGIPINVTISSIEEYPIHYHSKDLELIVVMEGTIKLIIGYRTILLKKGDIFIVNEDELHSMYSNAPNKILIIQFDLDYFVQYIESLEFSYMMLETYLNGEKIEDLNITLTSKIRELMELYVKKGANFSKKLTSLSIDLLTYMKSNFEYFSIYEGRYFINKLDLQGNPANVGRIREIYKFIYDNYDRKVTLQELAEEKHFSMYYLSHIIKDFVGISFKELLNFSRVEISEKYLLETEMRISEIALACGFSATRYYVKAFEEWYGQTPEEYRAQRTSHANGEIKIEVLSPQAILDSMDDARTEQTYRGNPLLRDFYSKVIPLNGQAVRRKRSLGRNNLIAASRTWETPGRISETIFQVLRNRFDVAEVISVAGGRPERELLKRFEFMTRQNMNKAIYEFSNDRNIQNHIGFFETLFSTLDVHGLNTENFTLYLADHSSSPEQFAYLMDYLNEEAGAEKFFSVEPVALGDSAFDQGSYVFDAICGTPYLLHGLLGNKKKTAYALMDDEGTSVGTISGSSGLTAWNGLKKAAYFTCMFYAMLGDSVVAEDNDYIITKKGDSYQLLFYDYYQEGYKKIRSLRSKEEIADVFEERVPSNEYIVEISNLTGTYKVTRLSLNEECCLFNKLAAMGFPEGLSSQEKFLLEKSLFPEVSFEVMTLKETMDLYVHMPRFGSELILLEKC